MSSERSNSTAWISPQLRRLSVRLLRSLLEGLGVKPQRDLKTFDYIAQFDSEEAVRLMKPDFAKLAQLELRGVCVTARGKDCDFVSRFFAPKLGVIENSVTSSANCELTPLWSQLLGGCFS
jgi:predicted PhzF superfamily epimerase YddE/YHI9